MFVLCRGKWMCLIAAIGLSAGPACEKKEAGPVTVVATEGKDSVKAVIGNEGGVLRFAGTGAKLEIPPKMLLEEVTVRFKRESPSFNLSKKDFIGKAYRISPRLDFAPGAAKLYVPIDKAMPGLPEEINLRIYYYDKLVSQGPEGSTFVHAWQVHPKTKFAGFSQDQKYLVFDLYETISDRTTKPPFGLYQAAFDMP